MAHFNLKFRLVPALVLVAITLTLGGIGLRSTVAMGPDAVYVEPGLKTDPAGRLKKSFLLLTFPLTPASRFSLSRQIVALTRRMGRHTVAA